MVIFNSYVKLPEGKCLFSYYVAAFIISGKNAKNASHPTRYINDYVIFCHTEFHFSRM